MANHFILFQSVIKKKYGQDATNVGDEGGFAPNIQVKHDLMLACAIILLLLLLLFLPRLYLFDFFLTSYYLFELQENKEGLELLKTAIAKAGYTDKVIVKS